MQLRLEAAEAEKAERAEKVIEDYLDYTCGIIEKNMRLDVCTKSVYADIAREAVPEDFWERFESNEHLFKTRLPGALSDRMEGVKVVFNSLSYGKEEDKYIFFEFDVVLDD